MLCCAIAHLMKLYTLIKLLMKGFSSSAVRWMKSSIITISTTPASYFSISIRARKPRIQHNLLETFAIFSLEITYERIVSFPLGETIYFKTFRHILQN